MEIIGNIDKECWKGRPQGKQRRPTWEIVTKTHYTCRSKDGSKCSKWQHQCRIAIILYGNHGENQGNVNRNVLSLPEHWDLQQRNGIQPNGCEERHQRPILQLHLQRFLDPDKMTAGSWFGCNNIISTPFQYMLQWCHGAILKPHHSIIAIITQQQLL